MKSFGSTLAPQALSLMRIVLGLLYLEHGTAKLFAFPPVAMFAHLSVASLVGIAGIIELVGGALAIVYCFTFLYFAAAGAGPWSVDALIDRSPR